MKIYLAGPLFSIAERHFNARLTALLRAAGHEVFLPQESEQGSMTPRQIFDSDIAGIDWADVVVASMDGSDPDSGTCWECGYAFRKKPIIVFRTDFRVSRKARHDRHGTGDDRGDDGSAPYNLMLTESATCRLDLPFETIETAAERIDQAMRELPKY